MEIYTILYARRADVYHYSAASAQSAVTMRMICTRIAYDLSVHRMRSHTKHENELSGCCLLFPVKLSARAPHIKVLFAYTPPERRIRQP